MNDDFDIDRIAEVPDPLAGVTDWPLPPRSAGAPAASPSRSRVGAMRVTALGAALLYELGWIAVMSKRSDLSSISAARLLTELSIPLGAALIALFAAAAPGDRGLGSPKGRLMTLALLAPIVFALATVVSAPADVDTEAFWPHAFRCFFWTVLYTAGPVALAAWAFRRSFAAAAGLRAAALGIACGALGAATMTLVCSTGTPAHVLVGHGGMMLVGAALGGLLGRRVGSP
jgi:hypothetical protein